MNVFRDVAPLKLVTLEHSVPSFARSILIVQMVTAVATIIASIQLYAKAIRKTAITAPTLKSVNLNFAKV